MENIFFIGIASVLVVMSSIHIRNEINKIAKYVVSLQEDVEDLDERVKSNHDCCHEHFKTFYSLTGKLRGDYDSQEAALNKLIRDYVELREAVNKHENVQAQQNSCIDQQRDSTGKLALNIGRSIEMVNENIDIWVSLLADFTKLQAMGAHIEVDDIEIDGLPAYKAFIMFGNVAFHEAQSLCRETAIMRAVEEACDKVDESEA